jgi:hypothetical protein
MAVVIMTTMLAVVMIVLFVAMVLIVAVIMRPAMVRGMRVRCMMVRFRRGMRVARIGAAFGIKGRLDLDDARAKPLHHGFDDMIMPDTQGLSRDLGRQMPVAEMPGKANQMMRVAAADLEKPLRSGHDLDQPAVFKHQRVTAAQRDRVLKIKQEFKPPRARHHHPPPVTIIEIKHDGIGRRLAPAVLSQNLGSPDHRSTVLASARLPLCMITP